MSLENTQADTSVLSFVHIVANDFIKSQDVCQLLIENYKQVIGETGTNFSESLYRPLIVVGPSGAGKGTLISAVTSKYRDTFGFSVSYTTRQPRQGEVHGKHYFYVSKEEFQAMVARNEFIEHMEVHNNFYGTVKSQITAMQANKKIPLLDIDVKGAYKFTQSFPEAIIIAIVPRSVDQLRKQLLERKTETAETLETRTKNAPGELKEIYDRPAFFNFRVVNEDLALASQTFKILLENLYSKEGLVEEVDNELIKKNLYNLGKTFNNARHAYLSLNLSQKDLTTINGIQKFIYLQIIDLSGNNLTSLAPLSAIKHIVNLNASNNQLKEMLDFTPPASLQWVDLSNNQISLIQNADKNIYLRHLYLDKNNIIKIENLDKNVHLKVLSLNSNFISKIENLDYIHIEELYISDNRLTKITGLSLLPNLRTLDLSKNEITFLKGLENIDNLRFLNLALNNISKVLQLKYVKHLLLLTELDFCFNPIQNRKFYKLQVLYHIPQLRMIDGVEISSEEKIKAESFHGVDYNDKQTIFTNLLPQEQYVDRRIAKIEMIEPESEDNDQEDSFIIRQSASQTQTIQQSHGDSRISFSKRHVGELILRVETNEVNSPKFVLD